MTAGSGRFWSSRLRGGDPLTNMPQVFYRQAARTAARVIEGSAFVVAVDNQLLLELNDVGTFVWEKLQTPLTVERLTRMVVDEFEVDEEAARADVSTFLSQLTQRGVVEVEGETG